MTRVTMKAARSASIMPEFKTPPERLSFELPGNSPACLLIHGFTGDTREMRVLAESISQQLGFYVYVPLLPGHGGPPQLMHGLSIDDFMDSAREALAKVRAQHSRVVVCAYSMGAAIAMPLIAEHPVGGFVAISPMLAIRHPLLPLAPLARFVVPWIYPLKMASIDLLGLRDELLTYDSSLDLSDPETLKWLRNEIRFPVAITDELRKMQVRARRATPQITSPTLIVQGSADLTLNPVGARRLYENVGAADKQIKLLPGIDHDLVKASNPANQEMIDTVIEWLRQRFS